MLYLSTITMKYAHYLYITLSIPLVIMFVALTLPRLLIDPGVDQYIGEKLRFANEISGKTEGLLRRSTFGTASRIIDIQNYSTEESIAKECTVEHLQYRGTLEMYGLFGVLPTKMEVFCQQNELMFNRP